LITFRTTTLFSVVIRTKYIPSGKFEILITTPPFGHPSNDGGEFTLDISNVPSGIYFLRIITENGIINRKIVKY